MIPIDDLYSRLLNGVLQNTSYVADNGQLEPTKKPMLVTAINAALSRLHSRFILKEGAVTVEMQEGRTNYPLLKKYAYQSYNPAEVQAPFIMDLVGEPFKEDVIKVLTIYDNFGCERTLNDRDDCWTIFTPRPYVIQNNRPRLFEALNVTYQQGHPKITGEDLPDDAVEYIDIPEALDAALDSYIAYLVFSGINTQESKATAADSLGLYNSICDEAVAQDLVSTSKSNTNRRFKRNGWI